MAAVELIRDDDVGDGDGLVVQVRVLPRRCTSSRIIYRGSTLARPFYFVTNPFLADISSGVFYVKDF